jgi:hypothetical protein
MPLGSQRCTGTKFAPADFSSASNAPSLPLLARLRSRQRWHLWWLERVLGRIRENHAYADMVNAKVGELKDQSDSLDRIVQMFKTGQESVH